MSIYSFGVSAAIYSAATAMIPIAGCVLTDLLP